MNMIASLPISTGIDLKNRLFGLPDLKSPLDELFITYGTSRRAVEKIAAYVSDMGGVHGAMRFFFAGASKENGIHSFTAQSFFDLEPAIKAIDADFWGKAMLLTDVLEYMPAKKRSDWEKQICDLSTPAFEENSVRDTLSTLLLQRQTFFSERVDGIFQSLSRRHVTNRPEGFSKRFIIAYMLDSFGYISYERVNYIHDIRCVIAKIRGYEAPHSRQTNEDINAIKKRYGEWHEFDGGAFRIKIFKKGTAHFDIHPDIAFRLNEILAWLYPAAIPSSFRQKPIEKPKAFDLRNDLIPFDVLSRLGTAKYIQDGMGLYFFDKEGADESVITILKYLGGTLNRGNWCFDYPIEPVLRHLQRTGILPEQVTHQSYFTKEQFSLQLVELANIDAHHHVLEPSAGTGGIANLLPRDRTTCVEISRLHCEVLRAKGFNVVCGDFLTWTPGIRFDRIIMNPPFSKARATLHLKHAANLLADNGVLVAVLPASLKGKELVTGRTHDWGNVISGAFDGTGVNVVTLKIY